MKKNNQIEILRGILVMIILFFHYTYRFSELYNIQTINFFSLEKWGTIGVGCFFIITGYLLIPKDLEKYSFKKFIKKKILRLYPSYLLCMTITFVAVQIWGLEGRNTSFLDYILNATMINGFINSKYVDGAHWYITYLIIFYIIVGLILKYGKNLKISLLIWLIIKDILKISTKLIPQMSIIYKFIGGDYVEFIIIGIVIKEILKLINERKLIRKEIEFYIGFILISIVQTTYINGVITGIAIVFFLIVFLYIVFKDREVNSRNFFYWIGGISYILYLIHQNIGYQILLKLCSINNQFRLIYIVIVYIVVILISYLIDRFYEKKIQRKY